MHWTEKGEKKEIITEAVDFFSFGEEKKKKEEKRLIKPAIPLVFLSDKLVNKKAVRFI